MHLKLLALKILSQVLWGVPRWIDKKFAQGLKRCRWYVFLGILVLVAAFDCLLAFGNGIPVINSVVGPWLSGADVLLGPIDEAIIVWPSARVGYELLRRLKVKLVEKGIAIPKSLEEVEATVTQRADQACGQIDKGVRQRIEQAAQPVG